MYVWQMCDILAPNKCIVSTSNWGNNEWINLLDMI